MKQNGLTRLSLVFSFLSYTMSSPKENKANLMGDSSVGLIWLCLQVGRVTGH